MQKRTEKEQGGLEAIVQLLRINESNSHALSTLNDTNTRNLEVVRGDIETLLKKIAPATAEALALRDLDKSKKKKQALLQALTDQIKASSPRRGWWLRRHSAWRQGARVAQ